MKLRIGIGIVLIVVGLAVFAVRLHHPGAYVMPHGGPLFGAVGALLIGGILLWLRQPRVLVWLGFALSPVALFPSIYSIVGELEEVVSLYVADAQGRSTNLRLWIVDREDGAWVGMSRNKALTYSLDGARLDMLRAGRLVCVIPRLHTDLGTAQLIHAMKVEKYAAARAAAKIGLYPKEATDASAALRLEPCPPA